MGVVLRRSNVYTVAGVVGSVACVAYSFTRRVSCFPAQDPKGPEYVRLEDLVGRDAAAGGGGEELREVVPTSPAKAAAGEGKP